MPINQVWCGRDNAERSRTVALLGGAQVRASGYCRGDGNQSRSPSEIQRALWTWGKAVARKTAPNISRTPKEESGSAHYACSIARWWQDPVCQCDVAGCNNTINCFLKPCVRNRTGRGELHRCNNYSSDLSSTQTKTAMYKNAIQTCSAIYWTRWHETS